MMVHKSSISRGFTIVELAVILMVISILTAISYVGFSTWRESVAKSEIRNDLTGVQAAMESAKNWGNTYPSFASGTLFDGRDTTKNVFVQSSGVTISYVSGDGAHYCIQASSVARPQLIMHIDTISGDRGIQEGACAGGGSTNPTDPGPGPIAAGASPLFVDESGSTQLAYSVSSSTSIYNFCVNGLISSKNGSQQTWRAIIDTSREPFRDITSSSVLSVGNSNYAITSTSPDSNGYFYIEWTGASNPQQYQYVSSTNQILVEVCINHGYNLFPLATLTPSVGAVSGGAWYGSQQFTISTSNPYWNRYQFDVNLSGLLGVVSGPPSGQKRVRVNGSQASLTHVSGTTYRVTSTVASSDTNSYIRQTQNRTIEINAGNFGDGILVP